MILKYTDILPIERLNRYRLNSNDTNEDLINNYIFNIRLSEAFYPAIALFEVILRNKIEQSVDKNIRKNWLIDFDNIHTILLEKELYSYNKAVSKLKDPINKGKIIAELSLGFWVGLFKNRYNTIIWDKSGVFDTVFPNFKGSCINRKKIITPKVLKIHSIRNRISHHEPIFDDMAGIDNCFKDIESLLYWISPESLELLNSTNRFWDVWTSVKSCKK